MWCPNFLSALSDVRWSFVTTFFWLAQTRITYFRSRPLQIDLVHSGTSVLFGHLWHHYDLLSQHTVEICLVRILKDSQESLHVKTTFFRQDRLVFFQVTNELFVPLDGEADHFRRFLLHRFFDDEESLTFSHFTDSCPQLTTKPLHSMEWSCHADKKKKLPCGPLLQLTGRPAHGYVPNTKHFERSLGNSDWRRCRVYQEVDREWHVSQHGGSKVPS